MAASPALLCSLRSPHPLLAPLACNIPLARLTRRGQLLDSLRSPGLRCWLRSPPRLQLTPLACDLCLAPGSLRSRVSAAALLPACAPPPRSCSLTPLASLACCSLASPIHHAPPSCPLENLVGGPLRIEKRPPEGHVRGGGGGGSDAQFPDRVFAPLLQIPFF